MKRNKIIIWIVLILAAIAIFYYVQNRKSTIPQELKDFAVKDTASITKIFMADMAGNKVLLEKDDKGNWKVNNKYSVRRDCIDVLLETMFRLEVKAPVSKKAHNNIVKQISTASVKVEIYQNDELTKVYYVGGPTQDHLGTYMILEDVKTKLKSTKAFIMQIAGFNGFLSTRFFIDETLWRDRKMFAYNADEIKSIKTEYTNNKETEFQIINYGKGKFRISYNNGKELNNIDTMALFRYISLFKNVQFEAIVDQMNPNKKDSIIHANPLFILTVTDVNNKVTKVKGFLRAAQEGVLDEKGKPLKYDVDRMWATVNDSNELLVIQYYNFDSILIPITYFQKK